MAEGATREQEIIERRELAKKMAMQRTKVVNRKKLSEAKEGDPNTIRWAGRKSNMLCFTGQEGNGMMISPSSVTTLAFFFIVALGLLNLFGPKLIAGL